MNDEAINPCYYLHLFLSIKLLSSWDTCRDRLMMITTRVQQAQQKNGTNHSHKKTCETSYAERELNLSCSSTITPGHS